MPLVYRFQNPNSFDQEERAEATLGLAAIKAAEAAFDVFPGFADFAVDNGRITASLRTPFFNARAEKHERLNDAELIGEQQVEHLRVAAAVLEGGDGVFRIVVIADGARRIEAREHFVDGRESVVEAFVHADAGSFDQLAIEDVDRKLVDVAANDGSRRSPSEQRVGLGNVGKRIYRRKIGTGQRFAESVLQRDGDMAVDIGVVLGTFARGAGECSAWTADMALGKLPWQDGRRGCLGDESERCCATANGAEGEHDCLMESHGREGVGIVGADGVNAADGVLAEPQGVEPLLAGFVRHGEVWRQVHLHFGKTCGEDGFLDTRGQRFQRSQGLRDRHFEAARGRLPDPVKMDFRGRKNVGIHRCHFAPRV